MWRGICGGELGGNVGKVGEGKFARVRLVADGEEADGVGDCVAGRDEIVSGRLCNLEK